MLGNMRARGKPKAIEPSGSGSPRSSWDVEAGGGWDHDDWTEKGGSEEVHSPSVSGSARGSMSKQARLRCVDAGL